MSDKKELIRQCFGADTDISWRPWGGYYIKTVSGGTLTMTGNDAFEDMRGGPDLYEGAVRLAAALGYGNVTITGDAQSVMAAAVTGQQIGIQVYAKARERFFGNDPAPAVPQVSGAHGTASIARDEMLRRAGLTGGQWGKGFRFGEDSAGNICRYDEPKCILLIGPPRKGKTTTVLTSALAESEQSSLVLWDQKCEHTPMLERRRKSLGPMKIIAPYSDGMPPDCEHYIDVSESYDPVADMIDPRSESRVTAAEGLAELIAPADNSGESTNSGFFSSSVQAVVAGALLHLVETRPDKATLPNMAKIVCSNEIFPFAAEAMVNGSPEVKTRLSGFGTPKAVLGEGSVGNIHATIVQKVRFLCDPVAERLFSKPKKPWRGDDLKRGPRPTTLSICIPGKHADPARPSVRVLLGCFFKDLQGSPQDKRPVTFVVDEWPSLGKVDLFSSIFATGGSAGIRVIGIAQNLGQIRQRYGEAGLQDYLGCSGLKIFLPPQHLEDAEIISRMAGRKTVLTMSHSGNSGGNRRGDQSGFNVGETGADVLTPHQIMAMGDNDLICFAPGIVPDVMLLRRRPYWQYRDIAPLVDANPNAPGYKPRRRTTVTNNHQKERQAKLNVKLEHWRANRKVTK